MQYKIPRGTYDILPQDSRQWHKVISVFRETAQSFGYEEIVTPVFEQADLFERSSGESSDIVRKEMYRFEDRKGRIFALRPEGTAPVVRSFVENHLDATARINRLYYIGPMFRYDRPQAGRYRQFYQYGVECIGSHHPYYDAEIIALQNTFLQQLGLKGITLEINSVGCATCTKDYEQALIRFYEPQKAELCPDCLERLNNKPRRLLDCKVPHCKTISARAPVMPDFLDADCRSHFEQVQSYLKLMNISYTINPHIVRGLDYYTHTAFEFLNNSLGAQNAVSGGGRYNGLLKQIGGMDLPAVGIAGGFERLMLSLKQEQIMPADEFRPDVYLILMGGEAVSTGIPLMKRLRQTGLAVIFDPDKASLKAQLKAADGCKARFAVIIGADEVTSGKLSVKNLDSKEQISCSFDELFRILGSPSLP